MDTAAEAQLLAREQFGMRFGLERMRRLLRELGDPQDAFPAVHVVGTNGKSSTALMTVAALRAQHLDAGGYISPHLRSFRERIDLGGMPIGETPFESVAGRVLKAATSLDSRSAADDQVTQFEAVTAIAFVALADRGVDVAVIEAGLGGRLDATNVIGDSRVQVLTSVALDHTEYLGETVEEIAREKLAVVRSRSALVCGRIGHSVQVLANRVADERDARLIAVRELDSGEIGASPTGFMRENAAVALTVADTALARIRPGSEFDRAAAVDAIERFIGSARLEGRLQIAAKSPLEIRDAAHNAEAAAALAEAVAGLAGAHPVTLVVAMLRDKNIDETLSELMRVVTAGGAVVCTQSSNPRSLDAESLAEKVRTVASDCSPETVARPDDALVRARAVAGANGVVVVTGSNYLLADLLRGPSAPAGATL